VCGDLFRGRVKVQGYMGVAFERVGHCVDELCVLWFGVGGSNDCKW